MQQFQGGLILWIGSKNGKRILKRLLECTLKSNCLAPPGAKLYCDSAKIYSDNTTFSGCHRFDQSAINLILYEESNFMPKLFQWNHPDFIVERSAKIF
uniref:ISXO2-like transposase domain-containing protein n=1 Tax=Panagrolaimus davidi TaxID=227884 RepID=A0A914QIA4_9BILA